MLDLPTALSKLLAVGMSLEQVIAACTTNPARAIGWDDRIGRLQVGGVADVAVLELVDGPATLRDCVGGELTAPRWLRACQTIRAGQVVGGANATER
jgi:dihydroorotase